MVIRFLFWISCLALCQMGLCQAQLVAPDTISTDDVFGFALTPDQQQGFWVKSWGGRDSLMILTATKSGQKWNTPKEASFGVGSRKFKDIDPFVAPTGQAILFNSNRQGPTRNFDIWMAKKTDSGWSKPTNLGAVVNSDSSDFYATMALNGSIYFASLRAGGFGKVDLYKTEWKNGAYQKPMNLGAVINTNGSESNPCISPKEDYLIFLSADLKDTYGDSDLYVSFRKPNGWTKPLNLGTLINTPDGEFCPFITPDEKYLYFSRVKKGKIWRENIYRVSLSDLHLDELRKVAQ